MRLKRVDNIISIGSDFSIFRSMNGGHLTNLLLKSGLESKLLRFDRPLDQLH